MNNNRNQNNLKNSSNTYLQGGKWLQWSDYCTTKEEAQAKIKENLKLYPTFKFMIKKIYDSTPFYRIYYKE